MSELLWDIAWSIAYKAITGAPVWAAVLCFLALRTLRSLVGLAALIIHVTALVTTALTDDKPHLKLVEDSDDEGA